MPAILPAIQIDSDAADARFLPYIRTWIADDSRMRLAEKSVRIGWTYGDAFKNVRKRLRHARRDYLFATKDQASAIEYCNQCLQFAEIYKMTKAIISHGEDTMKVPRMKDGKDTGFTDEVKFGYIKFDNKSRIIAFSSNPNAMIVYGGDVGLDEFPAHPNDETLWETAQGRITMGYDIGVWGAHRGSDTLFAAFVREAQAGQGGWSYYRVTMEDAIDMGYLDLIFKLTGKRYTKEEFLADCRRRARLEEIYQQAYMCNPRGGTAAIVPWSSIQLCEQAGHWRDRAHLEDAQIKDMFGEFVPGFEPSRAAKMEGWLAATFPRLRADRAHHSLGYDVAASGAGDLACIYVDAKEGGRLRNRGLLTFRTDDWHFHKVASAWFMKNTPSVNGAGDETGLGRQICWELEKAFSGQFEPVNFASSKHDMGFGLMNQLANAEKLWSNEDKDVSSDYFALRKNFTNGKRWTFGESSNPLNANSHCDIAWAGGLSSHAALSRGAPFGFSRVQIPGVSGLPHEGGLKARVKRFLGM